MYLGNYNYAGEANATEEKAKSINFKGKNLYYERQQRVPKSQKDYATRLSFFILNCILFHSNSPNFLFQKR